MSKIKLALLSGGVSAEREVSLKTGDQIFLALDKSKYKIYRYDLKDDLDSFFSDCMKKKFDIVFPAMHGPYGEDGKLQGMLDMLQAPYLFSGCLASALAMNKYKTAIIAKHIGLKTAPHYILRRDEDYDTNEIMHHFNFPVVVKPIELGSSVGISIANNNNELEQGILKAFDCDDTIMLEQFVSGRELTAAVMGEARKSHALSITEIKPKIAKWFDYKAKYTEGGSEEICPADIPPAIKDEVQIQAKRIYAAIGCRDLARADFIWDEKNNNIYFLEINTIPGMTKLSLVPLAAKVEGLEFGEFLDRLIMTALQKN